MFFLKNSEKRSFKMMFYSIAREKNFNTRDHSRVISDRTHDTSSSSEPWIWGEDGGCLRSRASADSLREINNGCRDRNGILSIRQRDRINATELRMSRIIRTISETTPCTCDAIIGTDRWYSTHARAKNCQRLPITSGRRTNALTVQWTVIQLRLSVLLHRIHFIDSTILLGAFSL